MGPGPEQGNKTMTATYIITGFDVCGSLVNRGEVVVPAFGINGLYTSFDVFDELLNSAEQDERIDLDGFRIDLNEWLFDNEDRVVAMIRMLGDMADLEIDEDEGGNNFYLYAKRVDIDE